MRREHSAVSEELYPYFQDVYDHILRVSESSDSLRDLVSTIVETNLSLRDYRQNQIVKKVSSWAAIIAVPALITGYYGMNVPYPGFQQHVGCRRLHSLDRRRLPGPLLRCSAASTGSEPNHHCSGPQESPRVCRYVVKGRPLVAPVIGARHGIASERGATSMQDHSAYVEVRKRLPGNSEYRLAAPDPSVVARLHLPVRDR